MNGVKIDDYIATQQYSTMDEKEKKEKREKRIANCVHRWIIKLKEKNLEFAIPTSDLVTQLCNFDSRDIYKTKILFKEIGPNGYVHPIPIRIDSVLYNHTNIWSAEEKQKQLHAAGLKTHPRGVDPGDKETDGVHMWFDLSPKISELFTVRETVRGTLTDIIMIFKYDSQISFGLQIATAELFNDRFNFHKIIEQILECLAKNLVVLLIGMVNNKIVGVYMIPPTLSAQKVLAKFQGNSNLHPRMLNKTETSSDLYKALEEFRYIHTDFQSVVKGDFKDLNDLSGDFLDLLYNNYHFMVNTPFYFSSLFSSNSDTHRTEWAGNVSFENNVANVLNITLKYIHGGRGDVCLDFGKFQLDDERKILKVNNGAKSNKSCILRLRTLGHQGMDPSKIGIVTAFIRLDRSESFPREPENFIGFFLSSIITASGNLALCPKAPATCELSLNCDVSNWSDYVEIVADKIAEDAYPESMQETFMTKSGLKKIRIKAVFYYKDLYPGSKRLEELRELYNIFAVRKPNESAITAYKSAVSDELIDNEKKHLKKNKS